MKKSKNNLCNIKTGKVKVIDFVNENIASRLSGMGIIKGTVLQIISNDKTSPIIIGIKNNRIALSQIVAKKILIKQL